MKALLINICHWGRGGLERYMWSAELLLRLDIMLFF